MQCMCYASFFNYISMILIYYILYEFQTKSREMLGMSFFLFFYYLAKLAIINEKNWPNLAIDHI
jgi:hypothetical protein